MYEKTLISYFLSDPNYEFAKKTLFRTKCVRQTYQIQLSSAIRGSQHPYIEASCAINTFRTRGNSACSHLALGGSGPPCTKNIPHLHALGPQFCMYTKKSPTYMHNYSNSACTRNTPGLHTQCTQSLCRGTHPHTLCHAQRSPQG